MSTPTACRAVSCDDTSGVDFEDIALLGGPVIDTGLPSGMQVDTYAEETIRSLVAERDTWKEQAEQHNRAYEELQRRVYKKAVLEPDLPAETVRRLNRLENEVDRYRTENKSPRENVKAANAELTILQNKISSQKNKLKGAGKKVRSAKGVAGEQEEKARLAVKDKQLRVSSEGKMKRERNEALAEAQSL